MKIMTILPYGGFKIPTEKRRMITKNFVLGAEFMEARFKFVVGVDVNHNLFEMKSGNNKFIVYFTDEFYAEQSTKPSCEFVDIILDDKEYNYFILKFT